MEEVEQVKIPPSPVEEEEESSSSHEENNNSKSTPRKSNFLRSTALLPQTEASSVCIADGSVAVDSGLLSALIESETK